MARIRKQRDLIVYVGTSKVGQLTQAPNRAITFRYSQNWLSSDHPFPISLSMPLSDRIWAGESASNYFDGLLPDDRTSRERIARLKKADSTSVFDLLTVVGRDCVGALRLLTEDTDPGEIEKMRYRPVDEKEITRRLASLQTNPLGLDSTDDEFRISIAGVQDKTAFLRTNDQWNLPYGSTPSSHIFKTAIGKNAFGADFSDTPWNEWLCLTLCKALGLETANVDVKLYGGQPILVVERFDRIWRDGTLHRLPQEDLCQALGFPPERKYQSEGGPDIRQVMKLLNGSSRSYEDRLSFMKTQVIFWLIAGIDGHAKNFSIFLSPLGFQLTPLYDVMSVLPYRQFPLQKVKMAMKIGREGQYRINYILPRHFYQTAEVVGLLKEDMDTIFSDLIERLDDALSEVSTVAAEIGVPGSTSSPILEKMLVRANLIQ